MISEGAAVKTVLRILNLKKSTYYRRIKVPEEDRTPIKRKPRRVPGFSYNDSKEVVLDTRINEYIEEIRADETGKYYGYKKITAKLRREYNLKINKKKVYRLMKEMRMLKKKMRGKRKYPRICRNHKITDSNKLWEMDTKYVFIGETRQVAYLTSVIDVFDRSIVGCKLSLSPDKETAKQALLEALLERGLLDGGKGLTLRTDNGSQFIAYEFEKMLIKYAIEHDRIPAHSPNYNAHIESYHRYLQDECIEGVIFKSIEDAETIIYNFVYRYNHYRIHSSIDYRTPFEFYSLISSSFKDKLVVSL